MSEKLKRFTDLMESMFELDKSDLDFGIYRIMNIRKAEIEKFLNEDLVNRVRDTLAPFASNTDIIEKRVGEIEKICNDVGIDVSQSKMAAEYIDLKRQLASGVDMSALETDVYSALYSFFNRYYDEGDFISKRRYKKGVYAVPYEGEEVKLYWANQDQYYIKTTENFRDYSFVDGEYTIHFRLVDATTEQNNNKESNDNKRVFMLYEENEEYPEHKTFEQIGNELIIRFVFDIPQDKKKKYTEENVQKIITAILSTYKDFYGLLRMVSSDPKKPKTLLEKHLESYVAKNTFDYFIHKDLRGFLTRELDFYIKSEIIHLDDLDTPNEKRVSSYLAKVKAIKRVGKIIIDFLAQLEDFQKKLWLKKKFVIETNWCITLDKVNERFYEEIISNEAQIQEWIDLFAINEIIPEMNTIGYSEPLTPEFLRQNQNLVLDTKHFTTDFTDRLIASIDNMDEQTNGLLIHSENFQALRLLQARYKHTLQSIYIDPPYNTDASEILYKNNYKHSSFLCMMENRLNLAIELLKPDALVSVAIDDAEVAGLRFLLNQIFVKETGIAVVRSNPQSRKAKGKFSPSHEYGLFYANSDAAVPFSIGYSEEKAKRYPLIDDIGHYSWMNFIRAGNNDLRTDRPKLYYPIAVNSNNQIRILNMRWDDEKTEYELLETPREDEILVYPIKEVNGRIIEKRWQRGHQRVQQELEEYRVRRLEDGTISIDFKTRLDEVALPVTWWDKNEYASSNYGAAELKALFGTKSFDYPKAIAITRDAIQACGITQNNSIVLDYFAGSGTTGHAVLSLNREDDGNRKYILVEMGEYFNTVTKPRIQKVIYSAEWKDGKPLNRNSGISQIMKYIRLESYEDTLSNIELSGEKHGLLSLFGDDYLINYMLDIEAEGSLLKLDCFKTPFDYRLKITENNETKEKVVDLAETFNYLLGLTVVRQSSVSYFRAVPNEQSPYDGAVCLVEDMDGKYGFKQIEGTMPDGRRTLIIWRTMTDDLIADNAALDAYFEKHRINPLDREFHLIFVNGDNNLENLRQDNEMFKVQITEIEFKKLMFEEE